MTKISRSKLELFTQCQRCFWLDLNHKVKRPQGPPFTINNAVDFLLKQEFDVHRENGTRHPVMVKYQVDAVPFRHEKMTQWRHNFTGVQFYHAPTDFMVYGAVDDIWVTPDGELMVVDYKATGANQHQIYDSYRRQMEIYQWLLRQNTFVVSPVGYFVFAKVDKQGGFGNGEAALSFDLLLESIHGDDSWVEQTIVNARKTLNEKKMPEAAVDCDYCIYREQAKKF
ncbi:MAG TPA: PD-(D/E)XK nuclease family protein [Candidatus Paceibacterota bacterium]|nr:PD-(D/E)XK nuclease family protein [Candidatus Paceibacterota bacterium]